MRIPIRSLGFLLGLVALSGIFYFGFEHWRPKSKKNLDVNSGLSEKEFHPWIHWRRDYNPPGYSDLDGNNVFLIKPGRIPEASYLLMDESFCELTSCEFFYFTGHIDSEKNADQKYYLVRSVKEKVATGQTDVSVDSSQNLYVRFGFLWDFKSKMEFIKNPIVVRLPYRPNQVYVDFMAAK